MGWTHYWERERELPTDAFEMAAKDCKLVLTAIDTPFKGYHCQGDPILTAKEIIFSGFEGQSCEPFSIKAIEIPRFSGKPVFSYCKTEHLPYDLGVKCALIILKHYLGKQIRIMSDGKNEDWNDAKQLCFTSLRYGGDFILDKDR
jgi:hypothetical protein